MCALPKRQTQINSIDKMEYDIAIKTIAFTDIEKFQVKKQAAKVVCFKSPKFCKTIL